MIPLEEVLSRLQGVKKTGKEWEALCPAHKDDDPSLGITIGDKGHIVMYCQAGCKYEEICAAIGVDPADLLAPRARATTNGTGQVVKRYRYDDEQGEFLFEAVRMEPKDFRQRRLGPGGEWLWNLQGVRRVLYRLPDLLKADPTLPVFIVEGEKDADNLWNLGLPATTNPMGAGKWRQEYTDWLQQNLPGRRFVILPDHDDPGTKHEAEVRASLERAGLKVESHALPGLPPHGDVSEWLKAGGTKEALLDLTRPVIRFPLLTIEAMLELPAPTWQVENLWEKGGIVMVFGEGSSGKTFLVVDIGMHIVCALPWHGRNVEGGPVIFVNADGGIPFRQRPQAWLYEHPDVERLYPFLIYNDRIDIRDRGKFEAFVDEQQQREQRPAVLMIDTFHRCMPGADENDAKDSSMFFDALMSVRLKLASTTTFLHHSNRADTGHRGHSSLRDDADTAIEVRKENNGLRRVRCDKQRNAPEFPEFWFDLRPVLDSCVIEMSSIPDADEEESTKKRGGPGTKEEAQISIALQHIIQAGEINRAALQQRMNKSQTRVSYYCRTLRQRGLIEIQSGGIDKEGRHPDIYRPRPELRR